MGEYQVVWRSKARRQYIQQLIYAHQEFGSKTFYKWVESVRAMEDRLRKTHSVPSLLSLGTCPRGYRAEIILPEAIFVRLTQFKGG